MNGDLGTGRDYEAYRQQYLFDTRHEAVRAGLGALVITFLVEVALNQWVAPLPLGWFLLGRLAVAAELALVYQLRSRFRQVNQLIFIWLNFATFAIFVGCVGAVLDARIGIPFYATAAYGLAAAGAQYPQRAPQALAHPASLATLFFVVYATTSSGWLEGVWVAGLAALTGPFTAFYGSLRLDQALREPLPLDDEDDVPPCLDAGRDVPGRRVGVAAPDPELRVVSHVSPPNAPRLARHRRRDDRLSRPPHRPRGDAGSGACAWLCDRRHFV